ncbi:hypothetical protein [Psychroserpens luteolus]|uniref:hypothetical protein n=1 Tax=Psychroserpens luteolus TaxID=2855840 RepID=UPI001E34C007|nr:hypothetical protein [Psychroserpens luteolus]MCD2258251.1 hypothetical protein [Psychroserpens luteolus]
MSENLPNNNPNEEVDLGILFNAIGNFFNKIFGFILNILQAIYSSIIYLIKAIIENFKLIFIVVLAALLLGFGLEKIQKPVFYSEMLVKPYFNSKYQLVSNIDYYNSLLESESYETLSTIFDVSEEDLKTIKKVEIDIGPETENQLIQEYDKYAKSIDSIRAQEVSFEDFVDNRDLYSSDIFSIRVESTKRDIFKKLSNGFKTTFSNEYSKKLMRVRDSTIAIKKAMYFKDLNKIDSLQKIYLKILNQESEKATLSVGVDGFLPITQERTPTKEYDLFQNELRIRDSIRVLDQLKVEENVYYDVLSNFSDIGLRSDTLSKRYSLVFPALAIVILFLMYITMKVIKYAKEYER